MIITRTPFRVSFLGGGTDFPEHYLKHGGLVVGSSIDKFCYVSVRQLPPYHDFKTKVAYSLIETVKDTGEIQHPLVRATIEHMKVDCGLEIHYASDLPARSGIGSSSSFAVGLIQALAVLKDKLMLPHQLAKTAIHIEREILQEAGGHQDQQWAAHGGLNYIKFDPSGSIHVFPIAISKDSLLDLESHLLLFYTGQSRNSSDITKGYANKLGSDGKYQQAMFQMAEDGIGSIMRKNWYELGKLMDRSWELKRSLSGVTSYKIDRLYCIGRMYGAVGGKLLGAGGGGCILFVVPPIKQHDVTTQLVSEGMIPIPFKFEFDGSRVIFTDYHTIGVNDGF
jgi:D-glycero-alpha-D-manno-heptose-7-phosphate kinase